MIYRLITWTDANRDPIVLEFDSIADAQLAYDRTPDNRHIRRVVLGVQNGRKWRVLSDRPIK